MPGFFNRKTFYSLLIRRSILAMLLDILELVELLSSKARPSPVFMGLRSFYYFFGFCL